MKWIIVFTVFASSSLAAQEADSLAPRVYEFSKLPAIKEENRTRKQVLEGSTTSLSNFKVHASTVAPGKSAHAAHVHNDLEELIIVKDGQLKITIGEKSKTVGPGSVAFAMPGDLHGFENAGTVPVTYYILTYKSKLPMDAERAKKNGGSFILNWDDLPMAKTEKGGRREFFNRPTSQLLKFEMHTTALNPGLDSHAQHTHKEEEIILLLRGNVTMHIGNDFHEAAPGDVIFLPSQIPHALKNTGKEQCEYFAFQWRN